jgi:mRNA interferase MazF
MRFNPSSQSLHDSALTPNRGDFYHAPHPLILWKTLILSQDIFNERSGTVITMAFTSQEQKASFPLTHEIVASKMPKRSWVKISQIRTLSTERIGKKIGSLSPEEIAHVVEGLNEIIGG